MFTLSKRDILVTFPGLTPTFFAMRAVRSKKQSLILSLYVVLTVEHSLVSNLPTQDFLNQKQYLNWLLLAADWLITLCPNI